MIELLVIYHYILLIVTSILKQTFQVFSLLY